MTRTRIPLRKRRGGYTLIEMVAVIAATSAVLLVSASTVKLALEVQGRNQGRCNEVRTLSAAAETFRADVHAAERIEIEEGKPGAWRLVLGKDRAAEYSYEEGRLTRREVLGEKLLSTREFELPQETAVTVAEESVEGGTTVVLTVDEKGPTRGGTTVVAILGHDRRFLKGKEKP